MAIIRFENGVSVNFNGTPTPEDIEEVAKKMALEKQEEPSEPGADRPTEGVWDAVKRGGQNIMGSVKESGKELDETLSSNVSTPTKLAKVASGLATGIARVAIAEPVSTVLRAGGELVQSATGVDVNEGASKGVNWLVQKGLDTQTAKDVMEGYEEIKRTDPEKAMQMDAALDVAEFLSYFVGAKGAKGLKTGTQKVATGVKESVEGKVSALASSVGGKVDDAIARGKEVITKTPEQTVAKREKVLSDLENQYSKFRKAEEFSKEGLEGSRKRISATDVLVDSVDDTGTIRTNNAVEQYTKQTIDGAESTVKDNLVRLGEKVNVKNIESALVESVNNSGLTGKDLTTALNNIKKEIAGYALKADENGYINLADIHDAKIATSKMVNYMTPPEVGAYRKSISSGLKKVVEKYSSFDVKKVNAELKKFYDDIDYLKMLDGKKIQGGKLGKYASQIAGSIGGGIAGGVIGGPVGAVAGTIAGGEIGNLVKGKLLKNAFGKATGKVAPKSTILDEAVQKGKSPRLMLPQPKEGRPNVEMPSGPTINLPSKTQTLLDKQAPIRTKKNPRRTRASIKRKR
jgi:hypothetical protein